MILLTNESGTFKNISPPIISNNLNIIIKSTVNKKREKTDLSLFAYSALYKIIAIICCNLGLK